MLLPRPRGPLSSRLVGTLTGPYDAATVLDAPAPGADLSGDDAALALWTLHELHYRGFDGVDGRWEWAPGLMGLRRALEDDLEARLLARWAAADLPDAATDPHADVVAAVLSVLEADAGRSLARFVQREATREQTLELLRQRSIYHLKEADPVSWVVPRLTTRTKAALVEIQSDEYGAGQPRLLHHHLFERGMHAAGLDSSYGAYVDEARLCVLEQNNALSLFGLQRRLRGAALGHFAAFESTSSLPSRQLAQGLTRLGFADEMVGYYVEHEEADAVHEQLALRDICAVLVEEEPGLRDDVLMGAWTCLDLEARTAEDLLGHWAAATAAASAAAEQACTAA